jgi:AcrR family transcriptional regulator
MKQKRAQPRKTPVQARAKVTWNAILDAAAQVLLARGYEKATTDRIAERAGVSVGSVYEYFPNKESIFAALTLRFNEERWAVLRQHPSDAGHSSLEQAIRSTVRARIAATRLNARLNTALNLEVPHHVTAEQSKAVFNEFLEISLAALGAYAKQLRHGNLELMVTLVTHATHAAVDNIAASNAELLDSHELEDEISLMMFRYLSR